MDRAVKIAVISACAAVTLAAIVVTIVVVRNSLQDRPVEESAKTEDTTPPIQKKLLASPQRLPIQKKLAPLQQWNKLARKHSSNY